MAGGGTGGGDGSIRPERGRVARLPAGRSATTNCDYKPVGQQLVGFPIHGSPGGFLPFEFCTNSMFFYGLVHYSDPQPTL